MLDIERTISCFKGGGATAFCPTSSRGVYGTIQSREALYRASPRRYIFYDTFIRQPPN